MGSDQISDSIIVTLVKPKTEQHFETKNKNEQFARARAETENEVQSNKHKGHPAG